VYAGHPLYLRNQGDEYLSVAQALPECTTKCIQGGVNWSSGMRLEIWVAGWFLASVLVSFPMSAEDLAQQTSEAEKAPLTVDQVVHNLELKNQQRAQELREFQGTRIYRMVYSGFTGDREADMTVELTYTSPGKKQFTILSEHGSEFILNHVLGKLLKSEADDPQRAAIDRKNYDFMLVGYENTPSGGQYILGLKPKSKSEYLYKGKLWVDAKDFAVTKVEGEMTKNPSFWVKDTNISHTYRKIDDFWLPAETRTVSQIRLGGRADLTIQYKNYRILATGPAKASRNAQEKRTVESLFAVVPAQ